jgi:vancomycin resistance protein YoaR
MEVYGYGFDLDAAQAMMEQAQYGDTLTIPMVRTEPAVLGGPFRDVYFRDVLCEYQTEHTTNERRNNNLTLACAAINGTVLAPGEEFDFNTVVGERTSAKGYQGAPAYSSGKTVNTIGGGVCQVSSTIYYTCLIADLEIINRLQHSYVSDYMPLGMDATVSWGGPEFTFKNNTNYPIRIETWVADGFVHCKLVGTDEKDYYVEMEYEVLGYQYYETVTEVYAPDNPDGYRDGQVIQTPYRGCTVKTYKLKYDKETKELISREEDRISKYKKRDRIVVSIQTPTEPPAEAPAAPPAE